MNLIEPGDQREFLIYGFRYALGRSSYAVYTVSEAIKKAWPSLSEHDRDLIQREIREAIESCCYGMECDKQTWERILGMPVHAS